LHNDRYEVFAVQVEGEKAWKVWDPDGLKLPENIALDPTVAPFRHTVTFASPEPVPLDAFPKPTLNGKLKPGALLYVPRGSLHVASTAGIDMPSLHITMGVMTQGFSYAIALFHVALEPDVKKAISAAGWDLHRFRQTLMRISDLKVDGLAFRQSLPFGWMRSAQNSEDLVGCSSSRRNSPLDTSINSKVAWNEVRRTLEVLLRRVLQDAPIALEQPLKISDHAVLSVKDVLTRQLKKTEEDLTAVAALPPTEALDVLELPASLHIAFIAWGVDTYGGGEIDARFSWCGRGAEGAAKARWPAGMLPMLQIVAGSTTRRLYLSDLRADSPMHALIFAVELTSLWLYPPIRLVSRDEPALATRSRFPNCEDVGDL